MIAFVCSHCGQKLQVNDDLAGQKVKCRQCGQHISAPGTPTATGTPIAAAVQASESALLPVDPGIVDPTELHGAQGESSGTFKPNGEEPVVSSGHAPFPHEGSRPTPVDATQNWWGRSVPAGPAADNQNLEDYDFLSPPQGPDEIGRLGPYRILRVLGAGGMGVVFLGEDPMLKRPVAIKAMLSGTALKMSNRQRFLREAQATAAIEHDHIVTIFQVGEHRNIPYLVMQFLQGESLDVRLRREGKLPVPEVLRIGRQVADGLAAAHERGLIHRDIKPANIWLEGGRSRVKILDFGLARATAEDSQLTQSGVILGTPAYMAPEQARGRVVDDRSDLFSLGCVLYHLCTGELPFKGLDTLAMLVALAVEDPRPIREINPDVPQRLADLVMSMLSKNPDERPASARAVEEALIALEKGGAVGSAPITPSSTKAPGGILDFGDSKFLLEDDLLDLQSGSDAVEEAAADEGPQWEEVGEEAAETPDSSADLAAFPADRLEKLVGRTLRHFQLHAVLGQGYHGTVFRAHDLKNDRDVALKVLSPLFPENDWETQHFIEAIKTALPWRHPNVVAVLATGKAGPYFWIAKELVEGESLAQVIERLSTSATKKIDWRRAFRVAVHIARALEFADQHNLVHRNITANKILWQTTDRVAKLNDLMFVNALEGSVLQRSVEDAKRDAELPYVPPEQINGHAYADDLSDVYSLGAVVYALLTGTLPFQGSSSEETREKILAGVPVKPRKYQRSIPAELEWVVLTMLANDRKYRFQTPTELLVYLERIAQEQGVAV